MYLLILHFFGELQHDTVCGYAHVHIQYCVHVNKKGIKPTQLGQLTNRPVVHCN